MTPKQVAALVVVRDALHGAEALTPGQPAPSGNDVLWRDEFRRVLQLVADAFSEDGQS